MNKLLVVVDYQNDFIDGALGFKQAKAIASSIVKKVQTAIKDKNDIVFTMDTHDQNYLKTIEGKSLKIKHAIQNTHGWQLHKSLLPYVKYGTVIIKNSYGADELVDYLRKYSYKQIEFIGVVTSMCVLSNVVIARAIQPEAQIIVNRKLVADSNKQLSDATFKILKNINVVIKS
ncbi:MAG: cysteine hydrolase [Mycoplasmataceae bacterium]|jgi:nicotinamidase-related amidase|nr:cysteine hydrolase [Mycoplasmataceae bacterium]